MKLKIEVNPFVIMEVLDVLHIMKGKIEEKNNQTFEEENLVECIEVLSEETANVLNKDLVCHAAEEFNRRKLAYQALKQLKDEIQP
jgi:predicted nucleic-acid-binding protein